jgi:ABC-type uncharacterized transport system involved in gliding motility auxiliary subunit
VPTRAGAAALPPLPQGSRASRILVVGSSDFATDLMGIKSPINDSMFNADFIVSAADWLSSGDDLVAIKSRGSRDSRLTKVQDPDARSFLISLAYIINLGFVPVLVIAFGLARSLKRRRLAKDEARLRTFGLSAGQGPAAAPDATFGLSAGQGPAAGADTGESKEGK